MSLDAMKLALEALETVTVDVKTTPNAYETSRQAITALRAAIEQAKQNRAKKMRDAGYTRRPALREFPREDAQPEQDARAHHKMMVAMMQAHWRRIDPQWKDGPELCHALGYEAGYKDAVARRVEPRASGSGAGFESLPASPQWQGLTTEEIHEVVGKKWWDWEDAFDIEGFSHAIEAKLREKNR